MSAVDHEFESRVAGIPCRVKVTYYVPPLPMQITGPGFGDAEPPQREDWEFEILDSKGRRAEWLQRKLTVEDEWRLLEEYRGTE